LTDLSTVVAFGVVVLVLLTLVSYMLYRRALEMGHPAERVTVRLVVFWFASVFTLGVGVYFNHLYPQGLFYVSVSRMPGSPVALVTGRQPWAPIAAAGLAIAVGAVAAWLAIRPLQNPPAETPEEKQP
jgi:hypothetical protein